MTDMTLHENGEPCPACALRREDEDTTAVLRAAVPCNICGGVGRVAIPDRNIIAAAIAWARVHYWPAFEARVGAR